MHNEIKISDLLEDDPIIAAVRDETELELALQSSVNVVFLLDATLGNLKSRIAQIRDHNKLVFVHLEMVSGLSKDVAALEFIKYEMNPAGIITTKPNLIKPAQNLGLLAIQRLFILDSLSVQTGLKMVQNHVPDFIEIMPGIIGKVVLEFKKNCHIPMIAGGLISTKKEIVEMLKCGVSAVSTSRTELWNL
ncbi:MAG TPA: glycerol-3-phosphate responsive antiterminator [Firmicutes bacterium]|jgi:glycerol uptake operon antiterminator|nr:glycerol-3-phosphate responsive antiterminator [Bacillota bacterium]